ncbi:MAG: hypothetical protein ACOC0J_01100 [Myxococcota bacterium]
MPNLSLPARLLSTSLAVFSSLAGPTACAHKAAEPAVLDPRPEPRAPAEPAMLDPRPEPPAPVEAALQGRDTAQLPKAEEPLPLEEPCAQWREPLGRPIKIHLNVELPDPPPELLSLLETEEDMEDVGARLLAETERWMGACVRPPGAEEAAGAESDALRVAREDGVYRIGLRLREPCALDDVGEIAGDFCLELSPAEGGGLRYTLSAGDLMVRDLQLGDVLLRLELDRDTGVPRSEILASMDQFPGDPAERVLAPLVPYLEAGIRAVRGLLDIGLYVLAHILVDVMEAGGYASDEPPR